MYCNKKKLQVNWLASSTCRVIYTNSGLLQRSLIIRIGNNTIHPNLHLKEINYSVPFAFFSTLDYIYKFTFGTTKTCVILRASTVVYAKIVSYTT